MIPASADIELIDLGEIGYAEALNLQRERQRELISKNADQALFVCEHTPVITAGRSTKSDSLLSDSQDLHAHRIEYFEVERGGDITYHGPGQFVAYPILDLHNFKTDVGWYMRQLEQVIIDSLGDFKVEGLRIKDKTGVWVSEEEKIASLGIKISRWRTLHGIAVNLQRSSQEGFSHIIPCGLDKVRVTSIEEQTSNAVSYQAYRDAFIRHFERIFSVLLKRMTG